MGCHFLPLQLAFPAAIALLLAFVTACIGRSDEDGETIALAAGGISPSRIAWYCLPVAILVISAVSHIAHNIMPEAYLRTRQEQAALVQRALAAKINRQEPLFQSDITILAAGEEGAQLREIIIWQQSAENATHATTAAYATNAWWQAVSLPGATSIRLRLTKPDLLGSDEDNNLISGRIGHIEYEDIRRLPELGDKPDGQDGSVLVANLAMIDAMRATIDDPTFAELPWNSNS